MRPGPWRTGRRATRPPRARRWRSSGRWRPACCSVSNTPAATRRLVLRLGALVPLAWAIALLFVPYGLLLVQSFWRLDHGVLTPGFTLDNYWRLVGTSLYPRTILYSAVTALWVTGGALLLAYPLAYLLAFKVRRHRDLLYLAVIIPLWVSYVV